MATQFELDCALMAGLAYQTNRDKINWFPAPEGWQQFSHVPNSTYPTASGFEAVAFQNKSNTNQIVISFAGTDGFLSIDQLANLGLATGSGSLQLLQAVDYCLTVKAANPNATITFAGHSLGGGLAALMAIFFDCQAVTFDQAPFLNSAQIFLSNDQAGNVTAHSVAQDLRTYLAGRATPGMLAKLDAYISANDPRNCTPNFADTLAARSALVSNINVQDEFLSTWPYTFFGRIGTPSELLTHGPADWLGSSFDLHSQALLSAFLQSDRTASVNASTQTKESLSEVTKKLTDLLKMIFDDRLFAYKTGRQNTTDENLLERLVRHEAGSGYGVTAADAMVTRFTRDLWKIAQEGGLTMNDANSDNPALHKVNNALIAFAMQKYYEETKDSDGYNKELFAKITGGLQFDMTDVSEKFKKAYDAHNVDPQKEVKLSDLSEAKGYKEYFQDYIANNEFSDEERGLINTFLPTMRDWYVQAGAEAMIATDTKNQGAFMLGGSGADQLTGGSADDLLVGNNGNDTLSGGTGNDILLGCAGNDNLKGGGDVDLLIGGQGDDTLDGETGNDLLKGGDGNDTYVFTGSYGTDVITDRDGSGTIKVDGQTLGSANQTFESLYKDTASGQTIVKLNGGNSLVILKEGSTDRILVNDWSEAKALGLTLQGTVPAAPAATINGDFKKAFTGNDYTIVNGNYVSDGAEANALDLISGTGGNDVIDGKGGDDALSGMAGDDWIEGGNGGDHILGGMGKDTLIGGAGDDAIYGSSDAPINKPTRVDLVKPVNNFPHPQATGFNWIAGYSTTYSNGVPYGYTDAPRNRLADDQGNLIDGGSGDDFIAAGTGADTVHGGADKDWIYGMDKDDVLFGDGENDLIYGDGNMPDGISIVWALPENHGNDIIDGGEGDDSLYGQGKDDIIFGGIGNDTIWGDDDEANLPVANHGKDFLFGGAGKDQLVGGGGDDYLEGGIENDTIWGGAGNDVYFFNLGDGVDTLYDNLAEKNILRFGAGVDGSKIKLGLGSLKLDLGNGDAIHIGDFDQNDVFNSSSISSFEFADGTTLSTTELLARGFDLDGSSGNDTIFGTNTTDRINGFGGDDALGGFGGNDVLNGGTGTDVMDGGTGNDLYQINAGDSHVATNGTVELITDVSGDDTIRFGADVNRSAFNVFKATAQDGTALLAIDSGVSDRLAIANGVAGAIEHFEFADGTRLNVSELIGHYSSFAISTSELGMTTRLYGGKTSEVLTVSGETLVSGGLGNDRLILQGEHNTLIYSKGDGHDHVSATFHNNVLRFSGGITASDLKWLPGGLKLQIGNDSADTLSFDNFVGNAPLVPFDHIEFDDGSTLSFSDLLARGVDSAGTPGDDLLISTVLVDRMAGGAGNDTYRITDAADQVIEAADEGYDTVEAAIDYQLADNVENLTLTGNALNATGNALNNRIIGNAKNNMLSGGSGDDYLDGGAGNDTLAGGDGIDSYRFSRLSGNDILVDSGVNRIRLDGGITFNDLSATRQGNDLLLSIRGDSSVSRLQGYFTEGVAWEVNDSNGVVLTDTNMLLTETNARASNVIGNLLADFEGGIKTSFSETMTSAGYVAEGNDRYSRYLDIVREGAYQTDIQIDTMIDRRVSDGYTRQYVFSEINDAYWKYYDNNGRFERRSLIAAQIEDTSAQLVAQNIQSDDASIIVSRRSISEMPASCPGVITLPYNLAFLSYGDYNEAPFWSAASTYEYSVTVEIDWQVVSVPTVTASTYNTSGIRDENGEVFVYTHITDQIKTETIVEGTLLRAVPAGQVPAVNSYDGGAPRYSQAEAFRQTLSKDYVVVTAGAGNNVIHGGDIINAGAGDDNVVLYSPAFVDGGSGNDLISAQSGWNYYPFPLAQKSILYGNDGDDHIIGSSGDDLLIGGAGTDLLEGGNGNDTYRVLENEDAVDTISDSEGNDQIVFGTGVTAGALSATGGTDQGYLELTNANGGGVRVQVGANSKADVETIAFVDDGVTLTTASIIAVLDKDYINGTGADEIFNTGVGDDTVYAAGGNDQIYGGTGNDLLAGQGGNDILRGGTGNDVYLFNLGDGNDVIDQSESSPYDFDVIKLGAGILPGDFTFARRGDDFVLRLQKTDESLTLKNWWPNNVTPYLSIEFSDGSRWSSGFLWAKSLYVPLIGTSGDDVIWGTSGNDTIDGGAGDDWIYGGDSGDILTGGAGVDHLLGGTGNDSYVVDNVGDVIVENLYEGDDQVQSSVTYTLSANIEMLSLAGSDNINGTGNSEANTIYGNAGNNRLDGGAGADALIGGGGTDTYVVDNFGDGINDGGYGDGDTVESSINWTLAGDLENLTLTGAEAINGTGNWNSNVLTGNSANNWLDGGAGNDVYVFGRGGGQDTISEAADGTAGKQNILRFMAGINPADVVLTRIGADLEVSIIGSTDKVTIKNFCPDNNPRSPENPIQRIEFADNTVWDIPALQAAIFPNHVPSGAVTIAGTAVQNQMLAASNTLADADGLGVINYQWQSSIDGNTWNAINGASASSFTLGETQVGKQIRVTASYTDGQGLVESMVSAATTVVANVNDVPAGSVSLSGTAVLGYLLTVSNTLADLDGMGTIAYQWQSSVDGTNWNAISGATTDTFSLTAAQVGKYVRSVASYTDGHGTLESVASGSEKVFATVNNLPTGAVSITGAAAQNQVLVASNTLADVDGLGTIGYQWQSSSDGAIWSDINGATTNNFTLTEAQVGTQLRVSASYTDGQGVVESIVSGATTAVANVNDAPTGSVTLTGIAVLDQVLSVSNTLTDADGLGAIGYQWQSSTDGTAWTAISGATANSFTLTEVQVGQQIRVTASYTDGHGTAESISSGSMAVMSNVNHAPEFLGGGGGAGIITTDLGSANDWAYGLTVQADGKYLVTGQSAVDGYADFALVRYNSNGSLDTSFNGNGKVTTAIGPYTDVSHSVAVNADGKILVGGFSSQPSTFADFSVVRYNSNGSLDTSFNGDGIVTTDIGGYWDQAYSMAVQADGKIIMAGMSSGNQSDLSDFALVRYNADGSLDNSFDGDGKVVTSAGYFQEELDSVTLQADGKILAAGFGSGPGWSNPDFVLLRYNSDGSLDTSFDGDGIVTTDIGTDSAAKTVTVQSDGKILVFGSGGNASFLIRYNTDGSLDTGFGNGGKVDSTVSADIGHGVTVQADGKILVTGARYNNASLYDFTLLRYNSDGSPDSGFGNNGEVTTVVSLSYDSACSVTVQADGKILLTGSRCNSGYSDSDFAVVRYNADGSLDTTFGSSTLIPDQTVNKGSLLSFTIPDGLFVDPDAGDTLTFSATRADGSALPAWLAFDSATRTFSGTPANGDVGSFSLKVTATDTAGASATSNAFNLAVLFVNSAPTGTVSVNGTATQNQVLTATNTLADEDGLGTISYQWQSSSDGIDWNALAGETGNQIVLTEALVGQQLRVVTSYVDGYGTAESITSATTLPVVNVNDVPILSTLISDQLATEGVLFSVTVPAGTFSDVDTGDVLTYSAQLADGSALPGWLTFNATTQVFQGTPTATGMLSVRVMATDGGGLSANDVFNITIEGINKTLTGTASADTLTGGVGDDTLYGLGGNDVLNGLAGNDTLDGGAGNDTLVGGTGGDSYYVSTGDTVTEAASAGTDTVISDVTWTLGSNLENLTLTGTTAINATGNTLANVLVGNSAVNTLSGGTGNDTMMGGAGNDIYIVDATGDLVTENTSEGTDLVQSGVTYTLAANVENLTLTGTTAINGTGNTLANTLTGNTGNNILDGGAGADSLIGGTGNDTYVVDDVGDVVTEGSSAGTDLVQSSVTYTLGSNVENLTLTGASAINATGNTLANVLVGNSAANILSGGTGADTMQGGAGDDTYVVDATGDVVTEAASSGTDLVQSSVTYTLGTNVENLTLTGTSALNATGNTVANTLTGNTGNNILDGGAGADSLMGGLGNDTYVVDNTGDVITENASEGTDLVQSSASYTLTANIENLTLTGTTAINGTGNASDNVLTGNSAANTLTGGAGNDTYVVDNVGDVVVENASEGTDLVQSSVTYTLAANIEKLTLTGTTAINGTGNALNNTITGNTANNILDGGAGTDTLVGGTGNDTYVVSTGDTVTEGSSAGTDTVISDATWTLGSNLENLTLSGTAAINGTGNTLANLLVGNSANNTLSGGTGADTMQGGAGDDTYVVDDVGDVVSENANAGTDLVQSGITYTLSANVENLTLTGSTAINGTGNDLANVLTGNSGANSLTGGAGNDSLSGGSGADTMLGGLGDDVYTVDNTLDVVTEAAGEGADLVNSSVTLTTLAANVEALVLTGTSALNGTGNDLANLLRGNTGNNVLNGGLGNDVLEGGAGNDTLTDTSGTAFFNAGAGTDTITGGAAAELYLGGLGNDTYTTAAGNDIILFNKGDGQDTFATGGTGSDTLSLGGTFAYSELTLSKSTNDLVLKMGTTDQITFKNWYATTPSKPVVNLQVIAEAMAGFSAGGSDPLLDQKVENFDFAGLVGAYDTARVANPTLTSWALTNALTSFQLAGSDTAALGGDLAYQYGKNGTLAGIGLTAAQDVINDANFGSQTQTLRPLATLQTGAVRLS